MLTKGMFSKSSFEPSTLGRGDGFEGVSRLFAKTLLQPVLTLLDSLPLEDLSEQEVRRLCGIRQQLLSFGTERSGKILSRGLYDLAMGLVHHPRFALVAQEILTVLKKSDLPHAVQAAHQLDLLRGEGGNFHEYCTQALHKLSYTESYGPLAFAVGSASLLGKGVRVLGQAWLNGGRLAAWGGRLAVHGVSSGLALGAEAFYFPAGNNFGLALLGGQMNWQHYGGEVLHGIQLMGGLNVAGLVSRNLGRAIHGVNEFGIATRARGFAPVTQSALSLGAELGVVSGFNYAENGGDEVFSLIEGGATLLNIRIARHLGEALVPALRVAHQSLDLALYRAGLKIGLKTKQGLERNFARRTIFLGRDPLALESHGTPYGNKIVASLANNMSSQSAHIDMASLAFRKGRARGRSDGPMDAFNNRLFMEQFLENLLIHAEKARKQALSGLRRIPNSRSFSLTGLVHNAQNRVRQMNEAIDFLTALRGKRLPTQNISPKAKKLIEFWLEKIRQEVGENTQAGIDLLYQMEEFWEAVEALPTVPDRYHARDPLALMRWVHQASREVSLDTEARFVELAEGVDWVGVAQSIENKQPHGHRLRQEQITERVVNDTTAFLEGLKNGSVSNEGVPERLHEIIKRENDAIVQGELRSALELNVAAMLRKVAEEAQENPRAYLALRNSIIISLLRELDPNQRRFSQMERFVKLPKVHFYKVPSGLRSNFYYDLEVPGADFKVVLRLKQLPRSAPAQLELSIRPNGDSAIKMGYVPLILIDGIPIRLKRKGADFVNSRILRVGAKNTMELEMMVRPSRVADDHRFYLGASEVVERKREDDFRRNDREVRSYSIPLPIPREVTRGPHLEVAQLTRINYHRIFYPPGASIGLRRRQRFATTFEHPAFARECRLLWTQYSEPEGAQWYAAVEDYLSYLVKFESLGKEKGERILEILREGSLWELKRVARILYGRLGPQVLQHLPNFEKANPQDSYQALSVALYNARNKKNSGVRS